MLSDDREFVAFVLDLMPSTARIDARRMFGGWGLYHEDRMVAIIHDGRLYFKGPRLKKGQHGAGAPGMSAPGEPFTYLRQGRVIALRYYAVTPEAFEDRELMARRLAEAMNIAAQDVR